MALNHFFKPITKPPGSHFFGYYGIQPWNRDGNRILGLEVPFDGRPPDAGDVAKIGLIDPEEMRFDELGTTRAWNFQQGCMLHWLPGNRIIFNDMADGRFISKILDFEDGSTRILPVPVSAVTDEERMALSLDFSRIQITRPGYGYPSGRDYEIADPHPENDGVRVMDPKTGENWLAVSMSEVYAYRDHQRMIRDHVMWFNHTLFNPSGTRFVFLSRFPPGSPRKTALFTCDLEGSDLRCLIDYGLVSHFDWLDDKRILAWADIENEGSAFYMLDEETGENWKVGEGLLREDGHCSFSPDAKWILTDTYPDRRGFRNLMAFNRPEERLVELGRFHSDPELTGEIRCDLHPRWSRDGSSICFDSTHGPGRQMYVMKFDPNRD